MTDSNSVSVPAEPGLHLTQLSQPKTENEKRRMQDIPYREAIGSLLFAARVSRPDIEYAVNQASQFIANYGRGHWEAVKRILRYLKGTIDYGIVYGNSGSDRQLIGYTDADYAGCTDTRKSTSGFIFLLNGGAVSWSSQKQRVVALSTTEAEYIAVATGTKEAIWLRRMISELGYKSDKVAMYVDNQSAIKLTGNPEYHKRTKHIDVRFHFVRDVVESGEIDVAYVKTNEKLADIFTKPLTKQRFNYLVSKGGMSN
ncbi:Retrovirus-related Pol polyprotein from transposon TNT 1-94 [Anthophora retusa]